MRILVYMLTYLVLVGCKLWHLVFPFLLARVPSPSLPQRLHPRPPTHHSKLNSFLVFIIKRSLVFKSISMPNGNLLRPKAPVICNGCKYIQPYYRHSQQQPEAAKRTAPESMSSNWNGKARKPRANSWMPNAKWRSRTNHHQNRIWPKSRAHTMSYIMAVPFRGLFRERRSFMPFC